METIQAIDYTMNYVKGPDAVAERTDDIRRTTVTSIDACCVNCGRPIKYEPDKYCGKCS